MPHVNMLLHEEEKAVKDIEKLKQRLSYYPMGCCELLLKVQCVTLFCEKLQIWRNDQDSRQRRFLNAPAKDCQKRSKETCQQRLLRYDGQVKARDMLYSKYNSINNDC